jgi:hypothetical protein
MTKTLPNVNLGSDQDLCQPSVIILNIGTQNPNYKYQWSKNENIILDENQSSLEIIEEGNYSIKLITINC